VSRLRLPGFVHEVIDDPRQRGILVAASLSLFAVGVVPRLLNPGLPTVQERLRSEPDIQSLFLVLSFLSAAAFIVGGVVSDISRRRGLIVASLAVMAIGAVAGLVVDDGPVYYVATFAAVAASGIVLAFAIGSVAVAYEGVPRATALGAVYGAYGAGTALAPVALTVIIVRIPSEVAGEPDGFRLETWPAYLLAVVASVVAVWAARRWLPRIPGSLPAPRPLIVGVGVWSLGILAIVVGVLGFTGRGNQLIPLGLVSLGVLALATLAFRARRTRKLVDDLRLDRRGLGAALAVGVAVGFAQTVPLALLPPIFEFALQWGHLFATVAIAPFVIALLVAGPISGALLARFGPRGMMTVGVLGLGLSDLLLAGLLAIDGQDSPYIAFVIPLALIGTGFVLATTVRTAIVFAATPRGLAATAAGINEASVGLGARIGVVMGAAITSLVAMNRARDLVAGRPDASELLAEFESVLVAIGTPRFTEVLNHALETAGDLRQVKANAFITTYFHGVTTALIIGGVVAIAGAALAWFLIGRRDPLRTVFDLREEREVVADGPGIVAEGPGIGPSPEVSQSP
jgi:MFS family permease